MGKRKTKLLCYGSPEWRLWAAKQHALRCMRCFPIKGLSAGKAPPDVYRALRLLQLLLDAPEIFLGESVGSQNERLELSKLIATYPEFTVAAIYTVFILKPNTCPRESSKSGRAFVRKFLLHEASAKHPVDGRQFSQLGLTDAELSKAVAKKYGIKEPCLKTVKRERERLERICGVSAAELVNFCFKLDEKFGMLDLVKQVTPKRRRSRARANYRKRMLDAFYKPQ